MLSGVKERVESGPFKLFFLSFQGSWFFLIRALHIWANLHVRQIPTSTLPKYIYVDVCTW